MKTSYTPVSYDFRETITEEIASGRKGKVFFFNDDDVVDSLEGMVVELKEIPTKGLFIQLDSGIQIRIDRIITLLGKPGAAYDEYDSFANACMECHGGHDLDKL